MKKLILVLAFILACLTNYAYDWDNVPVPAAAGNGFKWQLKANMSDDFNYTFAAKNVEATFGSGKWTNYYHNAHIGPGPTQWKHNHISVGGGALKIRVSRSGVKKTFTSGDESYTMVATQMGCVHSNNKIQYPAFIEARVWIPNGVITSCTWMLSDDDTQEIDIMENYGSPGDDNRNAYFAQRQHLSHHTFIRSPLQDYQPSDANGVPGTWYWETGKKTWAGNWCKVGVYWKSPTHLEYYIDGKWVRTLSDKTVSFKNQNGVTVTKTKTFSVIDKFNYTNGTGLNKKEMIIMQLAVQNWQAAKGRQPTDAELAKYDHTMKVDWIRSYKRVVSNSNSVGVTGVTVTPTSKTISVGQITNLTGAVIPSNATTKTMTFTSDKTGVATVNQSGLVTAKAAGTAIITVKTTDGGKTAKATITVISSTEGSISTFQNVGSNNFISSAISAKLTVKATAGTTEKFEIVDAGGGKVALKGSNGKYVSSENGTKAMSCIRSNIGAWEQFTMVNLGNDVYTLKGNNNKYVRNNMLCQSDVITNFEKFKVIGNLKKTNLISDLDNTSNSVKIYPNPVVDQLNISLEKEVMRGKVAIYDLQGRLVKSDIFNGNFTFIETGSFDEGIYHLVVETERQTIVRKLKIQ